MRQPDDHSWEEEHIFHLNQEIETLKQSKSFFAVTYMGNIQEVFLCKKDADEYSDKFGGVYDVEQLSMINAANILLK
jgi:hypothetical protein